jgi:hypothetical protein
VFRSDAQGAYAELAACGAILIEKCQYAFDFGVFLHVFVGLNAHAFAERVKAHVAGGDERAVEQDAAGAAAVITAACNDSLSAVTTQYGDEGFAGVPAQDTLGCAKESAHLEVMRIA